MHLQPVDVVNDIDPDVFTEKYFLTGTPVVIRNLSKDWPAYTRWNWDYFKELVGHKQVGLYNNHKSDAYTPINTADSYSRFADYIDTISKGPASWRIFLFNIFDHAPQLVEDFAWPEHLMKGFVKKYPMLFVGGAGSITHMHFDIDLSNILHTQFIGRKRVLLFPFREQHKIYRKPFEVLSMVDFTNYFDPQASKIDLNNYPAVAKASGLEVMLEHGDTLFMPGGYWHHMEYIDSGFAMSLRALAPTLTGKLKGAWNLLGMRTIDTIMKKTLPGPWYSYKKEKLQKAACKAMEAPVEQ
jgi:hypothetical protein